MQNIQKHPGARGASGCGKGTGQKAPKAKGSPGREKPPTGGPKGAQPMVITKAHRGKNRMLSRVVSTTLPAPAETYVPKNKAFYATRPPEQAKDFLKDAALRRQAMRKRREAVTQ